MSKFKEEIKNTFNKQSIYPLMFIMGIYLLAYSAIILANVYFADDMYRSVTGERGWENFSRYSTNILSVFLNFSMRLTDIYPLTQIIATIFITISSYILAIIFLSKKHNYYVYAASTVLGLNPYFLENMSYKNDSPFMSLAILASIFPFIFLKNRKLFFIISVISLLIMWTTYQAANFIYVQVAIFLTITNYLQNINNDKKVRNLMTMILSYCTAILIFKLFIYQKSSEVYVNNQITFNLFKVILNLSNYLSDLFNHFKDSNVLLFCLLLFCIFVFNISKLKVSQQHKIVIILIILSLFLSSYGLYIFLEEPLYRPRAYNGIGAFFALLIIMNIIITQNKFAIILIKWINSLLVMNLIIIALSYGNALKDYQRYVNFRIELMLSDLNRMTTENFNPNIPIKMYSNNMPDLSPVAENSATAFPIVGHLIYQQMRWQVAYITITHYFLNNTHSNHMLIVRTHVHKCSYNQPIIKKIDTMYHTINQYPNNCFEIQFHSMKK